MLNRQSNSLWKPLRPVVAAFVLSVLLATNSQAQSNIVFSWGDNSYLQTNLPAGLTNVVTLAAGANHTMALRSDGKVIAWGDDSAQQVTLPAGFTNAMAIGAGVNFSLAVRSNGTVFGWGDNSFKQGSVFSIALRSDGTVVAWGDTLDTSGELDVPPDLNGVIGIAASYYHALAVQTNGMVVGWGDDTSGQRNPPASLDLTNAIAVAAGSYHSLALKSDGTVVGWGLNDQGQISVPASVHGVSAITAGDQHSVALALPLSPILLSIAPTNGHIRLQFSSVSNLAYTIQTSTNLINWEMLGTATDSGNGQYQFEDTNTANFKRRFYRTAL